MIDNINILESRSYILYRLAFSRTQVESGKVISAATSVNINVCESHLLRNCYIAPMQAIMQHSKKTILTEANDVYHVSVSLASVNFHLDHR
ncbi:hypothetical protein BDR06DRAFT_542191 [Suillus hirtellus]|nr:hypothetical protein BDR06DRAFT_542191 [Suillus hirtellus]